MIGRIGCELRDPGIDLLILYSQRSNTDFVILKLTNFDKARIKCLKHTLKP